MQSKRIQMLERATLAMDQNNNLKNIIQSMIDGSFGTTLCRVCLLPLDGNCENVFTQIVVDSRQFCIAEILEELVQIKVTPLEKSSVCASCFKHALEAYKFYFTCQKSQQILDFYINEIDKSVTHLKDSFDPNVSVVISLPKISELNSNFDIQNFEASKEKPITVNTTFENEAITVKKEMIEVGVKNEENDSEENIFLVLGGDGNVSYYKANEGGDLELIQQGDAGDLVGIATNDLVDIKTDMETNDFAMVEEDLEVKPELPRKKIKRRRPLMAYKQCSRCPVKYRFTSKLKEHLKIEHGVDLFVCKICKATIESELEYHSHLQMHTNIYTCAVCGHCFKKRTTIISHLKKHEALTEGGQICEICGDVMPKDEMDEHHSKMHVKSFKCYYCGRMYKAEISFEAHIKKHEQHTHASDKLFQCKVCPATFSTLPRLEKHTRIEHSGLALHECHICKEKFKTRVALTSHVKTHSSSFYCDLCGRGFVDGRSLLWHQRLHTNERPYKCQVCERGFISVNRRNAHALCAHTAPTKQCPLCPALFHLRSMVNSHIKRVHLKTPKRRFRNLKQREVCWKTQTVPLQELSIDVQNELLDLQTYTGQMITQQ